MSSVGGFLAAVAGESDVATSSMPDAAKSVMAASFRSLLKIAEAESTGRQDPRWKLIDVKYDMRIFRKAALSENGSSMHAFRAMTTIEAPPLQVVDAIMNFGVHAKRWIPAMRELRVLKQLDDNTDVVYLGPPKRRPSDLWSKRRSPAQLAASIVALFLLVGGLWLMAGGQFADGAGRILLGCVFFVVSSDELALWPRDLVLMRHRQRLSDKTIVVGLKSVADESMPVRSPWGIVRGQIQGGGFIAQGLSNGKTRLSFVSQANFGGWAGIYGAYGMHVDQMALLISLKNFVHSELAAVALAPQVLPLAPTVRDGFDAVAPPIVAVEAPSYQPAQDLLHAVPFSVSPAGLFKTESATPQLTQVVSLTPDPFKSPPNASAVISPIPGQQGATDFVSPARRPSNKGVLQMGSRLGESVDTGSEEDVLLHPTELLANIPVRISFDCPRPPSYAEQALANRDMALRVLSETDGWTPTGASKGVQLFQKKMGPNKPNMARGVLSNVPCSAGYFVALATNIDRKVQWDPMFMRGNVVEVIDHYTHILYERFHPIFPTSARDFVILYSVIKRPDGSYIRCGVSVEHPDVPEVSGTVRGNLIFSSLVATPSPTDPQSVCDLTFTVWVDLKGSIPAWIVARVASEQPLILANIRDLFAREENEDTLRSDPLAARFERIKVTKGPPQTSAPIPLDHVESMGAFASDGNNAKPQEIVVAASVPQAARAGRRSSLLDANVANNNNDTSSNDNNVSSNPKAVMSSMVNGSALINGSTTLEKNRVTMASSGVAAESVPKLNRLGRNTPSMEEHDGITSDSAMMGMSMSVPSQNFPLEESVAEQVAFGSHDNDLLRALPVSVGPKRSLTQSEAQLLAQSHKRLLAAALDKSSAWANRGVQDDVVVLSRAPELGSPLRAFKGYGPVNASAERIVRLVTDSNRQNKWDPLYRCGVVLEQYEGNAELRYMVYSTPKCSSIRDMIVLMSTRTLPDGTCLVVAISRERPDIPVFKGAQRGVVEASGWVIQPLPDKPNKCMCTYICQVDMSGLSSSVVSHIASQQPLVVANIRRVLDDDAFKPA